MDVKDLDLIGIIAFDGITKNALRVHPDQEHLIYPMGNNVAIKHIATGQQTFLTGHTNVISALCVSPCGNFVASGQINHLGFKAMVIVWNYKERTINGRYEIHKVRVEDLCFTCNSDYLISLGGRDDGNVVIWDVRNKDPICGSFASNEIAGIAYTIARANAHGLCFVTGGDRTLKVWCINPKSRKIHGVDVKVGKLRRSINCVVVNESDDAIYCGTTSGDIIKARLYVSNDRGNADSLQTPVMVGCYSKIPRKPKKFSLGEGDLYAGGVKNLLLLENGKLIVGAGDGTVELVEIVDITPGKIKSKLPSTPQIFTHMAENVCHAVTSMVRHKEFILVGTAMCEIFQIKLTNFDIRLLVTCHISSIYTVAFPHDYSEIFATGGKNDIRLWRLETQKELLRITVPNFVCSSLCFSYDGRMIVSAWNDGIIRAFTPQTGKVIFTIHNAHIKAVSAVAITTDGTRLVSGGCDGQVRLWDIKRDVQRLVVMFKEHRSPITSLHISPNNEDLISSGTDGTCIIWDIVRCARKQVLMGNTMFMAACFTPNGIQILTCGTDRKIAYWETWDGSLVREIEGSEAGALNCIDTSPDGRYFVTGSNDCVVKVWEYETATTTYIGVAHAAIITGCKFSPDGRHIVTVSADGAIMIWKCPFELQTNESDGKSVRSARSCDAPAEDRGTARVPKIDAVHENVARMSDRADPAETIRTVYSGDNERKACTCDSKHLSRNTCHCGNGNDAEDVISTDGKAASVKSTKSISQKSSRSDTIKKSNTSNVSRERGSVKCTSSAGKR